jgi:2-iminobutanoate/2-iminopropanoate deaminase
MPRQRIVAPGGQVHDVIPQAVASGPLLFVSAIRGVDPATGEAIADVERQVRQAFRNLEAVLEAGGATLADVVRVQLAFRHLHRDRPRFNEVWTEVFGEDGPARSSIGVTDIGREGDATAFQMDVIAVRPGGWPTA